MSWQPATSTLSSNTVPKVDIDDKPLTALCNVIYKKEPDPVITARCLEEVNQF